MTMASSVAAASDILLSPMPQRPLGRTRWQASLLSLGGVKWDTRLSESDAIALLHRAMELGVNTFDTAATYGKGQSEERLGLALQGSRDRVFISTKTGLRDYDGARRHFDQSLKRLRTDRIDLVFVHGLGDNKDDLAKVTAPNSVLKALDEYRASGQIRFIGVSGHSHREDMVRLINTHPFDAVLFPVGLFNIAYDYSYIDTVLPAARQRGMAVMGMKVFAAGRVKLAASIEPYLRYSINQPIDTAVIGCDSIAQLERMVRIVKSRPSALPAEEQRALFDECRQITRHFDSGEFNWIERFEASRRKQ